MPATADDGLSFQDLILRVAVYLGVAESSGGVEVIPTNAANLAICKRLVNDGFRRFVNAYPRWNFLQQRVRITFLTGQVEGDNAIYQMPYFFTDIAKRPWTYIESAYPDVQWTDEARVMTKRSMGESNGAPYLCCSRRMTTEVGPTGWQVVFYPTPSTALAVETTVRAVPNQMTGLSDRHFATALHDHAVISACLAEAENHRDDKRGVKWAEYVEARDAAILLDQQSRPSNLGYCGNGRSVADEVRSSLVTTYNGVVIADTSH